MFVLVGPNGSGKSTFFDALMEVPDVDADLGAGTVAIGSSAHLERPKPAPPASACWCRARIPALFLTSVDEVVTGVLAPAL